MDMNILTLTAKSYSIGEAHMEVYPRETVDARNAT